MDRTTKIKKHQQALTQYIRALANEYNNSLGNTMNYKAIIDTEGNHFQFLKTGWYKDLHCFSVLFHLDIHPETGNIWIQQNNTEIELDVELEPFGIAKTDLVLGFYPIEMRKYSDYAAA